MKLQILVPHYHETLEEVTPLLESIALQQMVDLGEVGVIICHDGMDIPDLEVKEYPFHVLQIRQEHKGVSAARNTALDAAMADFVMFCDADDMFFSMCGIWTIFTEIGFGFNALNSIFIEEFIDKKTGKRTYYNREMDSTFVHGKVYRRSFLVDNNIRWDETLTIHEDSYFNCLAQKVAGEMKYCTQPFYMWKYRADSVCRKDKKYILRTFNNMLDSNSALVRELIKRNMTVDAAQFATAMIYDTYYCLNKDDWMNPENKVFRDAVEVRFKKYWGEFKSQFDSVSKDQRFQIVRNARNKYFNEGLMMEHFTFDDWISHIENDI